MNITVRYYDGITAAAQVAVLSADDDLVVLTVADKTLRYPLKKLKIHPQLGHVYPTIDLPDDGHIELLQVDVPDWLLPQKHQRVFWQRLWQWENKFHYVVLSMLGILVFAYVLVTYGIPKMAQGLANSLPLSTEQLLAQHTLKSLDYVLFQPTKLPLAKQQHIQQVFKQRLQPAQHISLVFRDSDIGANALALPNGTIVVTDDLVKLAKNDNELLAVLAHELGHVEARHGLRSALSAAGLGIMVSALTGDVESTISAVPTIFLQLSYSREFEREADKFAYDMMKKRQIPLHHFADILQSLANQHDASPEANDYQQTHPNVQERIQPFLNVQ